MGTWEIVMCSHVYTNRADQPVGTAPLCEDIINHSILGIHEAVHRMLDADWWVPGLPRICGEQLKLD